MSNIGQFFLLAFVERNLAARSSRTKMVFVFEFIFTHFIFLNFLCPVCPSLRKSVRSKVGLMIFSQYQDYQAYKTKKSPINREYLFVTFKWDSLRPDDTFSCVWNVLLVHQNGIFRYLYYVKLWCLWVYDRKKYDQTNRIHSSSDENSLDKASSV